MFDPDGPDPLPAVPATFTYASGDRFPVGVTTITFTASDVNDPLDPNDSNTAVCVQVITINDTELPVIDVCTQTVAQDADQGECFATVDITTPTFTDNCPNASISYTVDNPGFVAATTDADDADGTYPVGMSTITWTVSDNSGNPTTCQTIVTVTDTQDPTVTADADQTVDNDPGMCSAVVTYTAPTTMDNCPGETVAATATFNGAPITSGFASSDAFPVGVTVITFTVTDASGGMASASTTITVNDTENPNITCAADDSRSTDANACTYTVQGTEFDPVSTADNCAVTSVTNDFNNLASLAGEALPVGPNTVIFTVTDATGNTADCAVIITVSDQIAPTITCTQVTPTTFNADADVAACTYTVPDASLDATAADDCPGTVTITNDYNNSATLQGAAFPLGVTTVTFTATDASQNSSTCSIVINIVDAEAPEITCPVAQTRSADQSCNYVATALDDLATATDECDSAPVITYGIGAAGTLPTLDGELLPFGTTTIVVTATDLAGNTSDCSFAITVEDNEAPTLTLPQVDAMYPADAGACTAELSFTATATDNCNGSPTITYEVGSNAITFPYVFPAGMTTVVVTADDGEGQTDTDNFVVNVVDNEAPTFTAAANASFNNTAGACTYTVTNNDLDVTGLSDNCIATPTVEYSYDLGAGTVTSTTLNGVTFPVGATLVTITATDGTNESNPQNTTVTVVDNEAPTFTTASVTTFNNNTEECDYTVSGTELDVVNLTDNCGTATATYSYDVGFGTTTSSTLDGVVFPVGMTLVSITATDNAATPITSAAQTMTVTVIDNEAPTFIAATNASVPADANGCTYTVPGTGLDVTALVDNCGSATVTYSYDVGNGTETGNTLAGVVFPAGTTTVTIIATDNAASPNTSPSQTTEVTVTDGEAPVITLNMPLAQVIECPAAYTELGATATDNCDDDLVVTGNIVIDASAVDVTTPGTYPVTYNVMDASNNVAGTVTRMVTVEDNVAPTFSTAPMDMTVECDGLGNLGAYNTWLGNFAGAVGADACGTPSIAFSNETVFTNTCGTAGYYEPTFTVSDGNGNSTSATARFTIEDTTPPVVSTQDISIELDAAGGATISATQIDDGSTADVCNGFTMVLSKTTFGCDDIGANTVTLTVTDACSNSASTMATVTVNPTVVAVATPASETICSDGTTNIVLSNGAANGNPATFSWTVDAAGADLGATAGSGSTIAQTLENRDPAGVTRSAIYTITPAANTCDGEQITVMIDVTAEPVASDETVAGCSQQTLAIDLQSLIDNGVTSSFTWQAVTPTNPNLSGVSTSVNTTSTINDLLINPTTVVQTQDYLVTPTSKATGCTAGDPFTVTVEVFQVVNAFVLPGGGPDICVGDTRQLQAAANNGAQPFSFAWSISGGTGTGSLSTTSGVAPVFSATAAGTVEVQMIATDDNGCQSVPQLFTFNVLSGPTAVSITGAQDVCVNAATGLALTGVSDDDASDGSFSISPSSAASALTDNGDGTAVFNPAGLALGSYAITFTDGSGVCVQAATETIDVIAAPTSNFTWVANSLTVDFTETATGEANYSWDFGDNAGMSSDANPSYTFTAAGTYNVCLTVDNLDCTDTYCEMITVTFVPQSVCDDVPVVTGQNLISFDVIPTDSAVTTVFSDMLAANQLLFLLSRDDNGDVVTYDPALPPFLNTLSVVERGRGYQLRSTVPTVVQACGTAIDPTYRRDLNLGFNLVSYIPQASTTPTDYFSALISQNALITAFGYTNGQGQTFDPTLPPFLNTLQTTENGRGYRIRVNGNIPGSMWREASLYDEFGHLKSDQFTFYAGVNTTDKLPAGERIYIESTDGTVHGAMEVLDNGYFMTTPIYGDDAATPDVREGAAEGQRLIFRYGDQVRDIEATFSADGRVHLVELDFELRTQEEIPTVYDWKVGPSPFTDEANISFYLKDERQLSLRVLDMQGRVVTQLQNETVLGAGLHRYQLRADDSMTGGLYFVQLIIDGRQLVQRRIVLQR